MAKLDTDEWKDKSVELANDLAKQFIALALGGIAFAVGITSQDAVALRTVLFWVVIGAFALSSLLGFGFLMHGVSSQSQGKRLELYSGAARWVPMLQIAALVVAVVALLLFHVDATSRTTAQETKVTIQQGGKDTTLAVQAGRTVTIAVSPTGDLKAEVK